MTFVVDEKRKYDFNKNEFIILKIIENELKEKHGLNIKEFKYKNQKLNLYKSLKDNKLEGMPVTEFEDNSKLSRINVDESCKPVDNTIFIHKMLVKKMRK